MVAKLVALVLPLGLDTFAVCCALGMAGIPPARRGRISLLMVAFEAGMPLVGVAVGAPLGHAIGADAEYVAIGVLALFGGYTLLADEDEERAGGLLDASGWTLAALGLSVSVDELAVGFALGLLRLPVAIVIAAIAVQTVFVTQLGLRFGARLGERVQERAERTAGLALLVLAAVLLGERLAG
ncbi:MAG TPA: manganese efflux pump [Solirubrobacteraceae bacterium]|nr:manganese efflux pump [Solirubrobacteraceae bacterium]